MNINEVPEQYREETKQKFSEGRVCSVCGAKIELAELNFTQNKPGKYRPDRFCRKCMSDYWFALRRGLSKDKFRTTNQGVKAEAEQGRKPLPVLQVGKKYKLGGEYTGRVVAIQGSHFVVETRTGTRCFTKAQLVGVEIKEA